MLSSASAPFTSAAAAVTLVVRDVIVGDYNRNGAVDAADYVVWRNTLGSVGIGLPADGSGNDSVDLADYTAWRRGFGLSGGAALGAGSAAGTLASVPEPAFAIGVLQIALGLMLFTRSERSRKPRVWLTIMALVLTLSCCLAQQRRAAQRTWIGGDGTWTNNVGIADWSGSDEPDSDDEAIFNSNNVINLGSVNFVQALTMSASAEVNLNDNTLNVGGGLTSLTGSGTRLEISAAAATLNAQNISISNNAVIFLDGGTINSSLVGVVIAQISTASGGILSGNGKVSMPQSIAGITTVIDNNGILAATNPSTIIFGAPPAGHAATERRRTPMRRIDLDGSGETGVVSVGRNQTLDIDIPLFDIFNGGITMSQNSKLDMSSAWILGAFATLDVDNGAVGGIGGAPAGTATIAGGSFSQNSGTITVVDTDGTLQFDAPFTMNGGTLVNNGHLIFNNDATINTRRSVSHGRGRRRLDGERRARSYDQSNEHQSRRQRRGDGDHGRLWRHAEY